MKITKEQLKQIIKEEITEASMANRFKHAVGAQPFADDTASVLWAFSEKLDKMTEEMDEATGTAPLYAALSEVLPDAKKDFEMIYDAATRLSQAIKVAVPERQLTSNER